MLSKFNVGITRKKSSKFNSGNNYLVVVEFNMT